MAERADRILFLTRRFPPSIGGIQRFAYHLHRHLVAAGRGVHLIALRPDPLFHLAWFIPLTFLRSFVRCLVWRPDVIYFADGVTACLAPYLRPFTSARFVVKIHGAELAVGDSIFSRLILRGTLACDRICVVSRNTGDLAIQVGAGEDQIRIAYNGIEPDALDEDRYDLLRGTFEVDHGIRFGEDRVLLSIGRQIPRKGVVPFLEQVVPGLQDTYVIICGDGPEHDRVRDTVTRLGLDDRVWVLGRVDNDTTTMLRRACDLFVMPNIVYPNDVEGYGIAPLEAMYEGLPVIAFAVDALTESVREGGHLIAEEDYAAFANQIRSCLNQPAEERQALREAARAYVLGEYSWTRTGEVYLNILDGD